MPEFETLLRGDANLLIAGRLCLGPKAAMLVEPSRVMQSISEAEAVVDCACKLDHFAVQLHRLVWKTKMPQGKCQITAMSNAGILAHKPGPERRAHPVV